MTTDKLYLYWHTLRHLKPVQLYGRLWFRLYRPYVSKSAIVPPLHEPQYRWQKPAVYAPSMLGAQQFRFLNQEHSLPPIADGWNDDTVPEKLWLYNLHYFDDLNARDANTRSAWHRAWLHRWLAENIPAKSIGWEPYPTSLRIVNWIKWLAAGSVALPGMLVSLPIQAKWLTQRLEWHLMGNHLFKNAKALVFVGLFFDGSQAASWLAKGLRIISHELPEQILADGGHFELSPMYHAIFLEDLLDLINAANHWSGRVPDSQIVRWRHVASDMLYWLAGMTHPDGEFALFNDAAFNIAPNLAELRSYAMKLGIEDRFQQPTSSISTPCSRNDEEIPNENSDPTIRRKVNQSLLSLLHFPSSGYVRIENNNAVAFLDIAHIGPDHLPAHAHADTLSFELSVFGQRVVVNGGTSRYGLGSERQRERGTSSHSTSEIMGQNSSEVWGGFRVARRAYPFDFQVHEEEELLKVECSHDGYTNLPYKPVHRREWVMDACSLWVMDEVRGGQYHALARYILHPSIQIDAIDVNNWKISLPGGQNLRVTVLEGCAQLVPALYAPEFGTVLPTQCLAVEFTQTQATTKWQWN